MATVTALPISSSTDTTPSSPPGLDSSRTSSKSSSLESSSLAHDTIHDISHFEDIALTDSPSPEPYLDEPSSPIPASPIRTRPMKRSSSYFATTTARNNKYSASSPNLVLPPSQKHRQPPKPIGPVPSPKERSVRNSWLRTPSSLGTTSPNSPQRLSPPTRSQTFGPQSRWKSAESASPLARRTSWQPTRRKSTKELEDEYDDLDEELPEDAVVWNIPLSPRPVEDDQFASLSPSVSLSSHNELDSSVELAKTRSKSWQTALSTLTPDIQKLTNELEVHHSQNTPGLEEDERSANSGSPTKSRQNSVVLPPLRKNEVMIDPLPVSKEKEKFLTRTRPSWLPPKCPKEEKKHLKEYQRMMASFMESEKKRSARQSESAVSLASETNSSIEAWQKDILDNWETAIDSPKARELWWRGVPAELRAQVWTKAIGNDLHLTSASYSAALARADRNAAATRRTPTTKAILADVASTFPSMKQFQSSQSLHAPLVNVLHAYAAYRSDTDYTRGTSGIAALLLHVFGGNDEKAFVTLANIMNRPVSLAYCLSDDAAIRRIESLVRQGVQHKMPRLAEHLAKLAATEPIPGATADREPSHSEYSGWLDLICTSLFTGVLDFDDCLRVWDVMLFERESFLIRAVVGLLRRVEGKLYGSDIIAVDKLLGWQAWSKRADYTSAVSPTVAGGMGRSKRRNSFFGGSGNWDAKSSAVPAVVVDGVDVGGSENLMEAIRWAGKEEHSPRSTPSPGHGDAQAVITLSNKGSART